MEARRLAAASLLAACTVVATACARDDGGLPTYDPGHFCSLAALLPVRIEGDPGADPPIWGIGKTGRVELVWPIGFTLHTTGGVLEVLDTDGKVVARQGELLVGAGGGGASGEPDAPIQICIIGTRIYTSRASGRPLA